MSNLGLKILTVIIVQRAFASGAYDSSCGSNSSENRSLGMTVNSMKSDLGKWTDTFSARAEHSDTVSNISVDVLHNVSECSGRRVIHIKGLIQNENSISTTNRAFSIGSDQQISADNVRSIVFHSKHGSNVVVSNGGRTIKKKNRNEVKNGTAFTNRALENNELFQVRLDKKGEGSGRSFGFGILTKSPEEIDIPLHMYTSQYAWMCHGAIYNAAKQIKSCGIDVKKYMEGDTFGVMKKSSGDIHFFVNETDQGPAVTGITDPVYGVVDLYYGAQKVTILKP